MASSRRSRVRVRPEEVRPKAKPTASTSASTTKGSSFHESTSSFVSSIPNRGGSLRGAIKNKELCPVTGYLSDISREYNVSSTVLGKGHYGCVHECTHRMTRQQHAVKSIEKSK